MLIFTLKMRFEGKIFTIMLFVGVICYPTTLQILFFLKIECYAKNLIFGTKKGKNRCILYYPHP